ncbi:hypothetical protein K7432_000048 [Basidiobolus ranarum]|uniref:Uncharacterized protein n=1 Tax=Basidiobolus ranarum TaxID=34480 RepID=A0ABR2X5B7_9FUNG
MSASLSLASALQPSTFHRNSVLTSASFTRSTTFTGTSFETCAIKTGISELEEIETDSEDDLSDTTSNSPTSKNTVVINQVENITTIVPFYRHPRLLAVLKVFAFNLFLPFLSGVFMGFGEICANEVTFKWGWVGARTFSTGLYSSTKDK